MNMAKKKSTKKPVKKKKGMKISVLHVYKDLKTRQQIIEKKPLATWENVKSFSNRNGRLKINLINGKKIDKQYHTTNTIIKASNS